jgi:hypothetical protein
MHVIETATEGLWDYLRSVHVTQAGDFSPEQRGELRSVLREVKQAMLRGEYGKLRVGIADTFNFLDPTNELFQNLKRNFVVCARELQGERNLAGKGIRIERGRANLEEKTQLLLREFGDGNSLHRILETKKTIPFDRRFLLPMISA